MRTTVIIYLVLAVFVTACNQKPTAVNPSRDETAPHDSAVHADSLNQTHPSPSQECKFESSLLFEDEGISTYTEDSIRGAGIVSFKLNTNDRLDIYNMDETVFGGIVLNEGGNYFTLTMPQKTTARRLIPAEDFAAFDFDAEPLNADPDYLLIYVNKEKRKVKKSDLKYTYQTWPEYLRGNLIRLKPCNLLKASNGTIITKSLDQVFEIMAVKGDLIEIKSSKDCPNDVPYLNLQGGVKWRTADGMVVDFASCD